MELFYVVKQATHLVIDVFKVLNMYEKINFYP